jgi:hypothetical protein
LSPLGLFEQIRVDFVARFRLRGIRTAVDRRDAHPLHQRGHMQTPSRKAFPFQKALHHPATCEGLFQMQFIDPAHQRQFGRRNRAGGVAEHPPADAERLGLFRQRQGMLTVNHRFALGNPALVSAPAKKSFVSVNSPIFAWSSFTSTAGGASGLPSPKIPAAPSRS